MAPQQKRGALGCVNMSERMSMRVRLFRSAVLGILGAGAALVLMLSVDFFKRPYATNSLLMPAALIGGVIGAALGFFRTDPELLNLFRKR
jgi:hypothetical protein